jgi:hypothetical protein
MSKTSKILTSLTSRDKFSTSSPEINEAALTPENKKRQLNR